MADDDGLKVKFDPARTPVEALHLSSMGATDREMAEFWGIPPSTFYNWRLRHPAFAEALTSGKDVADERVERALYNRAVGYSYDAVKHMTVSDGQGMGSHIETIHYVEHVPPDVKACIRWLEARRSKTWRRTLALTPDAPPLSDEEKNFDVLDEADRNNLRTLLTKAVKGAGQPRVN